ncbi:MAG: tRNA lysidine(34) synthetase TilS [Candidatus Nomurabacteria bacterium]|jgi:tRNA(Ile)-lysidine synthase|nr:tRNA lysidine(34) synthetase TilS [Candidatus Nomurabacteria bacterium]
MNYVLAISGGVDSVVLLDMASESREEAAIGRFIIAHFDHGIRTESNEDAELVRKLAEQYGLPFELRRARLGHDVSEEEARVARYEFLRSVQKKYAPAKIVTAHHQDDLIETIVINLIRGTGWRGLAPMNARLERPLLEMSKAEIVRYAIENQLDWAEDQTNYTHKYFRNRVRGFLLKMTPEQRAELLKLNAKQRILRREIEKILSKIKRSETIDGKYLLGLAPNVAHEVLRVWTRGKLTAPQLKSLLKKLGRAKSGDLLQSGGGVQIGVYRDQFTISRLKTLAKR